MLDPYNLDTLSYLLSKCSGQREDYLSTTQLGRMDASDRKSLVSWMFEVSSQQGISSGTTQLGVNYVDCFLSCKPIKGLKVLKLIGWVCLSLALKYEEGRSISPGEIQRLTENKFLINEVVLTEIFITKALAWDLDRPTASECLGSLFENTCERFNYSNLVRRAEDYIKLCYLDYQTSLLGPLAIAVSAALTVMDDLKFLEFRNDWLELLVRDFSVDRSLVNQISSNLCSKAIHRESDETSTSPSC